MKLQVKICGITKAEQGRAIAQLGATALGFMCVEESPRYITPEHIRAIVAELPLDAATGTWTVDRIGVFVDRTLDSICQTVHVANLNGVQLHGSESPEFCQQLRQHLPKVQIIKALRVRSIATLEHVKNYTTCVDSVLLDAYHPTLAGGTGQTLDWTALRQQQPTSPWFLAGGLTPDNVLDALSQVSPTGIDLSSGVERAPGDKKLEAIARLFSQLEAWKYSS